MPATPRLINQGQTVFHCADDSQVLAAAQFKFKELPGYRNQANHDIGARPQPDLPNELHRPKVQCAKITNSIFPA